MLSVVSPPAEVACSVQERYLGRGLGLAPSRGSTPKPPMISVGAPDPCAVLHKGLAQLPEVQGRGMCSGPALGSA